MSSGLLLLMSLLLSLSLLLLLLTCVALYVLVVRICFCDPREPKVYLIAGAGVYLALLVYHVNSHHFLIGRCARFPAGEGGTKRLHGRFVQDLANYRTAFKWRATCRQYRRSLH
ncbi:unnamed protein product, partial [Scytosiphon promiscuus]